MRKHKILIISPREDERSLVKKVLEPHDCVVSRLPNYTGIREVANQDYELIILDDSLLGSAVRELASDTKTKDIPRVLLTESLTGREDNQNLRLIRDGLVTDIIQRGRDTTYSNLIEAVNRHAVTPLRIGLISLGRIAQGITRTLLKKHPRYVREIGGVSMSQTPTHTEEELKRALELEGDERFKLFEGSRNSYDNLRELLSQNYDLVILTSSGQAKSRVKPGRNWLWYTEREVVLPILKGIREAEEKGIGKDNLYMVCTNPIGSIMTLLAFLKIEPSRITGLSLRDTARTKQLILEAYKSRFGNLPGIDEIEVRVVGQHGMEVPDFESVRVQGKTLEELGLDIKHEEFIRKLRRKGGELMRSREDASREDRFDLSYLDVPEDVASILRTISRRRQLKDSLYSFGLLEGVGYLAFNGPVTFDYSGSGIRINSTGYIDDLLKNENPERDRLLKECAREARFQATVVSNFLIERGLLKRSKS